MNTIPDIKATKKGSVKKYYRNYEENCPEYLSWPVVCQAKEQYETLCFNIADDTEGMAMAYEYCDYCIEMAERLRKIGRVINDLWKTSSLVDSSRGPKERPARSSHYAGAYLKSRKTILNKYKSRRL